MGLNVGVGAVDEAVDRNAVGAGVGEVAKCCSREELAAVDQRNMPRPFVLVTVCRVAFRCGCEPKNASTAPEIATAMTGGAVSGVAFVFLAPRKRNCNDGRPEGESFLLYG